MGSKAVEKIAERNFYVYKIGQVLWNNTFVSDIREYNYVPKCPNRIVPLVTYSPCMGVYMIDRGYHSYKWIAIDNTNPHNKYLYLGNYENFLKENLSLYEHCCIATFIIPKGAKYFENEDGHIVSSSIIYTGKYLRL